MAHFEKLSELATRFCRCEAGTTGLEYGIIGVLISTAVISGARSIGSSNIVTMETIASVWPG